MGHGIGNRDERGATLVEFALIVPLLLLLLFGIVEFARVITEFTTIRTAAREGARYATTVDDSGGTPHYRDCAGIIAATQSKTVVGAIDQVTVQWTAPSPSTYAFTCSTGSVAEPDADEVISGTTIEVTVESEFEAVVPILEVFLDGIELDSTQSRQVFVGVVDE